MSTDKQFMPEAVREQIKQKARDIYEAYPESCTGFSLQSFGERCAIFGWEAEGLMSTRTRMVTLSSNVVVQLISRMEREYQELTDGQFGSIEEWPQVVAIRKAMRRASHPPPTPEDR